MEKEKYAYTLGYRISRDGKTVSFRGRNRKLRLDTRGYLEFVIRGSGRESAAFLHISLHRLQAYQKFGDLLYADGVQCRHLNGNEKDNSYDNIGIGSAHDNAMDKDPAARLSASRIASKCNPLRYPKEKILSIKNDRKRGMTYKEIMEKYGISSKGTVFYICNHDYIW